LKKVIFRGFLKLRKNNFFYGHFSKWFLAEGRFPAASGVWGITGY
jgi:hypothetical protein